METYFIQLGRLQVVYSRRRDLIECCVLLGCQKKGKCGEILCKARTPSSSVW